MTLQEALLWGRRQLSGSPTAAGDARLLFQHVLGVGRSYLVANRDVQPTPAQLDLFRSLVARAREHEPIPYLVGEAPFYGLDFYVTPDVLIPRPETEMLVEAALTYAQAHPVHHLVDVGTGSGCIAISFAHAIRTQGLPPVQIDAVDLSPAALTLARQNAARHAVAERIHFRQGSLLEPVVGNPDLIVANLPYITDEEWTSLDHGVKWYEPATALQGGSDGLTLIRQLLEQARSRLNSSGAIFLEIGWRQGNEARQAASEIFSTARISVLPDFAGHDRMVVIETS